MQVSTCISKAHLPSFLPSFVVSAIPLFAGNDVVVTVPSGGMAKHNSTQLNRYRVEAANFILCDTWGLQRGNYQDKHRILPAVLGGWLPSNWKMEHQLLDHKEVLLTGKASRHVRRVHAVLFFLAARAVRDEAEMEIIKESFQKVWYLDLSCIGYWMHVPIACIKGLPSLAATADAYGVPSGMAVSMP